MLHRLTIRAKLAAAFVVLAMASALVGSFGLVMSGRVSAKLEDLAGNRLPSVEGLGRAHEGLTDIRFHTASALAAALAGDEGGFAPAFRGRERGRSHALQGMSRFSLLAMTPEEEALWRRIDPAFQAFLTENSRVWAALREHDPTAAAQIQREMSTRFTHELDTPFEKLVELQAKIGDAISLEAQEEAAVTRRALLAAMGGSLALAAAFLFLVVRSITRPLAHLAREARSLREAVVAGRLEVRGDPSRVGVEFRPIVEGINETMDAFSRPIRLTARYVTQIAAGEAPPYIDDEYAGDFDRIKQSLNELCRVTKQRGKDLDALIAAAVEGRLSYRADPSRYQGGNARLIDALNRMLDAIVTPVNDVTAVLERLAARDLRARVEGDYQGDHAKLARAASTTAQALDTALTQVAAAVQQVSDAAAQIEASAGEVASGASQQASALHETTAAAESAAATTQQSAESASRADALARSASAAASGGACAIGRLQGAMVRIEQSAEATSQIVKDVSEIAFQTNLLALNAAVEAARAGEAGRGFAVVAEEVRSLALRAREAARRTEALVQQSVKEASDGEVAAREVEGALSLIVKEVTRVTGIVSEIASSAEGQASSIGQVERAIAEIDAVTQRNAASAEESSSTASDLSRQAADLAAIVATFQLEGGEAGDGPGIADGGEEACAAAAPRLPDHASPPELDDFSLGEPGSGEDGRAVGAQLGRG